MSSPTFKVTQKIHGYINALHIVQKHVFFLNKYPPTPLNLIPSMRPCLYVRHVEVARPFPLRGGLVLGTRSLPLLLSFVRAADTEVLAVVAVHPAGLVLLRAIAPVAVTGLVLLYSRLLLLPDLAGLERVLVHGLHVGPVIHGVQRIVASLQAGFFPKFIHFLKLIQKI